MILHTRVPSLLHSRQASCPLPLHHLPAQPAAARSSPGLPSRPLPHTPAPQCPTPRGSSIAQARLGGYSATPEPAERILASLPYLLPFLSAFPYARYLIYMYPTVKAVMKPVLPMVAAFHGVPFGSFIAFFAVYLGLANNTSFSRFVRFNAMQALLLDVLLVLPRLLETVLTPASSGLGLKIYAHSQSFIFIFTASWVLFSVVSSMLGQWGRIPFVGEAAEAQLR